MAPYQDLLSRLAAAHPRFHVPHHVEAALAVIVLALDLRNVIGFSSFGVPVYYAIAIAIANAAAATQPREQRRSPCAFEVVGVLGCLVLTAVLGDW